MIELFSEMIRLPNLFATILLGLVLLYWLLMIFGLFGIDMDADLDMDIHADVDAGIDGHIGGGAAADVLTFFHVGEVPVMILGSFFVLFFWITTMCSNHMFNSEWSVLVSAYCLIPNIILAALVTKLVIWPMTPVFRGMKGNSSVQVQAGTRGVVDSPELDGQFGRIRIENDGPPIVVNAITANGQKLKQDQEVVVVRFEEESGDYVVEPVKPEKK